MTDAADLNTGDNAFAPIDPKLTTFALANGIDLLKSEGLRRLIWFREGLERGLEIRSVDEGVYSIEAASWRTKTPDEAVTVSVSGGVPLPNLSEKLEAGIEVANSL